MNSEETWNWKDIAAYVFIILVMIWVIAPLYWVFVTAFKPMNEFLTYPPTFWPSTFTLENFHEALILRDGADALYDSFIVASGTWMLSMLCGLPAAYSIARYKTGGENLSFTILSMRFLPPICPAVAFFILSTQLGLFDSYTLLILANSLVQVPLVVWLMKGFMEEIPYAIEEAAQIDGASWTKIVFDHILPLSSSGLIATSLFVFIFAWNELLFATLLTGRSVTPYTKIIPGMTIGHAQPHWGAISALGLIAMVPILLVSWFLQKYVVRGITFGTVSQD